MVDTLVMFIMFILMSVAINRISKDWNKTFDILIIVLSIIVLLKL